ncbi:hypothetical protein ACJX0J_030590, partial [Zea mays]
SIDLGEREKGKEILAGCCWPWKLDASSRCVFQEVVGSQQETKRHDMLGVNNRTGGKETLQSHIQLEAH